MPRTLKDWLLCLLFAEFCAIAAAGALCVAPHLEPWLQDADQFTAQQRQSAVSQARAMANAEAITADAKQKAPQLLAAAASALHNTATATANIESATAGAAAIAAAERASLPEYHKAAFDLWRHADRTLGHIDAATAQEQTQQAALASNTTALLAAGIRAVADIDATASSPDVKTIASHLAASTEDIHAMTADGRQVADYAKEKVTRPLKWWQRITGPAEEFAARFAAYTF